MKTNEQMKADEEKINSCHQNQTKIHLTLTDRTWRNGTVKSIHATYFFFEDEVNGEEPIFFIELRKIEPYIKKEEGNK